MWKEKYEELQKEHKTLIEAHDALAARVAEIEKLKTVDWNDASSVQRLCNVLGVPLVLHAIAVLRRMEKLFGDQ